MVREISKARAGWWAVGPWGVRGASTTLLQIYELTSEVCNAQARHPDLLPQYVEQARRRVGCSGGRFLTNAPPCQVMQKNCMQWVELFLHFADVSNPLKPFDVSDPERLRHAVSGVVQYDAQATVARRLRSAKNGPGGCWMNSSSRVMRTPWLVAQDLVPRKVHHPAVAGEAFKPSRWNAERPRQD